MKSFACVVLLAAMGLAAPGQRDKRGYLSGWSSLDHSLHSLDHAHSYHGISDYSLHESIHLHEPIHHHHHHDVSYIAPSHKIVSYNKLVGVPKVVEVKKVVSIPKVVSVPKVISVSRIVEEPHHISYGAHGWW